MSLIKHILIGAIIGWLFSLIANCEPTLAAIWVGFYGFGLYWENWLDRKNS